MKYKIINFIKERNVFFILSAYFFLIFILRYVIPERSLQEFGQRAITDAFFALNLVFAIILVALSVGTKFLDQFKFKSFSQTEIYFVATTLGLGTIALGIFILGLFGFFNSWAMLIWTILLALWSNTNRSINHQTFIESKQAWMSKWKNLHIVEKSILIFLGLLGFFILLQALAPPTDYDGLMYHLVGPKIFLDTNKIIFIPDIWQANGPMIAEMLYCIGIGFNSDSFSALLHAFFGSLFLGMTFAIAKRVASDSIAWLSLAILLGIPVLSFWASWAYTDYAWSLFEITALFCFILWMRERENNLIILAGVMSGFALGSKFLAIGSTILLTTGIIWTTIRLPNEKKSWTPLFFYGITIFLVASPWYLKNLFLTGNPVFPFYFGGPGFDDLRQTLHMEYLQSWGTGDHLVDYLTIPLNVYLKPENFSNISIEVPSLLFPAAIIFPFWYRNKSCRGLALYALVWGLIWSFGSLQTRFLLPVFPILAILTAVTFDSIKSKSLKRMIVIPLVGGTMLASVLYQGIELINKMPLGTIIGVESKNEYLERNLYLYPAIEYINVSGVPGKLTLFLWSGQSYYCENNCIPDTTQIDWLWLTKSNPDPIELATTLGNKNISYILFSPAHLEWFLRYHDPFKDHRVAYNYLTEKFIPSCGDYVFQDEFTSIIEITCPKTSPTNHSTHLNLSSESHRLIPLEIVITDDFSD